MVFQQQVFHRDKEIYDKFVNAADDNDNGDVEEDNDDYDGNGDDDDLMEKRLSCHNALSLFHSSTPNYPLV